MKVSKRKKTKIRLYTTKERSIKDINIILNKTYERSGKIRKLYQDIRNEIMEKIEPISLYNRLTYPIIYNENGTMYQYHLTKNNEDGSFGISKKGELELKDRNEVIDFLLSDDESVKLGNEFHRLYKLLCNSQTSSYKVKKILSKSIDRYLYDNYNVLYKYRPDNIIIIKIDYDKYCVKYDSSEYSYAISETPIEIDIK